MTTELPFWTINDPTIPNLRMRAIEVLANHRDYPNLDTLFEHADKITNYCLGILEQKQ